MRIISRLRRSWMPSCRGTSAAFIAALLTSTLSLAAPGDRSPDGIWEEVSRADIGEVTAHLPTEFRAHRVDFDALLAVLRTAPLDDPGGGSSVTRKSTSRRTRATAPILFLPMPQGVFEPMYVEESPILSADLAAIYPHVKTYALRGAMNPALSARLTLAVSSAQVLMVTPDGLVRLTPLQAATETFYLSFFNRHRTDGADQFDHPDDEQDEPDVPAGPGGRATAGVPSIAAVTGPTLRTYRLAASATGEYYQARLGPNGIQDVVDSIVAEINNANALFEPELAIRLQLDWIIIWLDANTDPYTTVDGTNVTVCDLRNENVAATNSVINAADYDIGYVFSTGGGNGCAWYVLCLNDKARGAGLIDTANVPPGGSTGLLAHEMGHQFGARHTFSGSGCVANEFNQTSAYEPGSGSTIMSYLGSCGTDNVVTTPALPNGMYYHGRSFDEIVDNVTIGTGSTCGSSVATGNSAPNVDAGSDYTIPRGTPFTLTGSATDPESDPLTYVWEQFDVAANQRAIDTDTGEGPIFRSIQPASDPSRTFPTLSDILNNTQTPGEILPSMDRTLNFRLTARDNRVGGGGVSSDGMVVTVAGDPFFITSPNGGEFFGAGCPVPVTWTIGGGSVATDVSLLFSGNGGNAFSSVVASTPNDGQAEATAPCTTTADARMKAAAVNNVFFDVSDNDFSVAPTPPSASVAALGGEVDENCELLVEFSGSVADDCGISANDVTVQAFKQQNNFTLGPVMFNAVQVDPMTVSVTGTVLVSDVVASPAVLTIEIEGSDACGASDSDDVTVEIVDATPPTITVDLDPNSLWPPNHKMHGITATVVALDNCPGVGFVLTSVTSSEPDNGRGDGNTVNDVQDVSPGTVDLSFLLRAERSGNGKGRVYTATYTATDASNNETSASAEVIVKHDRRP